MYQCYLGIITVSSNKKLAEILKTASQPEDCSAAVIEQSELTENVESYDSAVIFDGIEAFKKNAVYLGVHTRTVVIIPPEAAAYIGDVKDRADDIWVVPSEGADDLVGFYAEKLIMTMKAAYDFRLQTICMATAFDSIPDLVWFKDVRGAHLMVNNSFCEAVDKTKEQIYKKGHYYIWDIYGTSQRKSMTEATMYVWNPRTSLSMPEKPGFLTKRSRPKAVCVSSSHINLRLSMLTEEFSVPAA